MIKAGIFTAIILFFSPGADAQCDILNRVYPDGSMMYSMEPVKFYWTEAKELYGNVVTDKENYFLALRPVPFPAKTEGKKLKGDMELILSNQQVIELSHYDTQYIMNDSIMEVMYLLNKKDIDAAHQFEAESVKLNMGKEEGDRTYVFKLHKTAFQDQLECFLDEEKKD
jgi:hypothetical protein